MTHRNILTITTVLFLLFIFLAILTTKVEAIDKKVCIYFSGSKGVNVCKSRVIFKSIRTEIFFIYKFEIYNNRSNLILLKKYFDKYHILEEERGIPMIFISNSYLIGDKPILDESEEKLKVYLKVLPVQN